MIEAYESVLAISIISLSQNYEGVSPRSAWKEIDKGIYWCPDI